jgi:hypothetical protein
MISYCIVCYRPIYCRLLIEQLVDKTTAAYEILVWINILDDAFEQFLLEKVDAGAPIRVVGRTPQNIGMSAYRKLFAAAKFEMVTQIDDDVVCISPYIAERAQEIFDGFPQVGMLTADAWQDEYTTGARPPMQHYREFNQEFGLYDGPIDGWFSIYRRESLQALGEFNPGRYYPIGCHVKAHLASAGRSGLLCTRFKVFHVTGPAYAYYFNMLNSEIAKFAAIGRRDVVDWYERERRDIPARDELESRVQQIRNSLMQAP